MSTAMSTAIDGPQDAPDIIIPEQTHKKTMAQRVAALKDKLTTRQGLLGDYNYGGL
jgi:hypothetical protein